MNNKKEQERAELHKTIWKIADELRGSVDGWDFKQYILGLLFYRFISENLTNYLNLEEHKAGNSGFEYSKMQHNDDNFDLENDPQAILYYYGYIGAALYLAFIGYFVLHMAKQLILNFKDSFNLFNFTILITLMLQIFATIYSGYLLRRPNVAIYLSVVLLLIHCRTEPLFCKKKRESVPSVAE